MHRGASLVARPIISDILTAAGFGCCVEATDDAFAGPLDGKVHSEILKVSWLMGLDDARSKGVG